MTVTDKSGRVLATGELEDYISVPVCDETGCVLYIQHTLVVRDATTERVLHTERDCVRKKRRKGGSES